MRTEETAYIGVRKRGKGTLGNEGDKWILGVDGFYYCVGKYFKLTEEQIQSDFKNGFLIKATDKNAVQ